MERVLSIERFQEHLPPAQALVVIPTYNERENIIALLEAVQALETPFDIFVVDDGSPDGTAELVAAHAASACRRIMLMRRSGKHGLGSAYLDAFRWVQTHESSYRVIVQMDADFSHDPARLSDLVGAAETHGVAVGSRYVPGGSAPDWDWRRRWISRLGNVYARWVLRLATPAYRLRDSTAGFTAYRTDALRRILDAPVWGSGYAYQISMKYRAFLNGDRPVEIPITFPDRRAGASKMDSRIIAEAVTIPWRLVGDAWDEPSWKSVGRWTVPIAMFCTLLVSALLIVLPDMLIAWRVFGEPFGRIPFIAPVLFDTSTYVQWLGAAVEGWPDSGGFFSWLGPFFQALGRIPGMTTPELWEVTRIGFFVGLIWALWTVARSWGARRRTAAALVIAGTAFPVLTLMMRPGAYSWYLVPAILGFWLVWLVQERLERRQWTIAAMLSAASLFLCLLYPWYALADALMIVGVWSLHLLPRWRAGWIVAGWTIASALAMFAAWIAAPLLVTSTWQATFDLYARTGIAWSRLPVITNSLLATVLFAIVALRLEMLARETAWRSRITVLVIGWVATVVSWLHSLFTGLYIHNANTRAVTLIMAWMTVALVVTTFQKNKETVSSHPPRRWNVAMAWIGGIAAVMVLRAVWLSPNVAGDHLQQIHLAIWLALLFSATAVHAAGSGKPLSSLAPGAWVALWIVAGGLSYGFALATEVRFARASAPLMEPVVWMRIHVPERVTTCTVPGLADDVSAQAGRRVYPSESTIYLREPHATLAARMTTILARYMTIGPEERAAFHDAYAGVRLVSCNQFGATTTLLRAFGVSQTTLQALSGCQADAVEDEWGAIRETASGGVTDAQFRSVCSVVIAPWEERLRWRVPPDYREVRVGAYAAYYDPSALTERP